MYAIVHHYLTFDDQDRPAVEVESADWDGVDPDALLAIVRGCFDAPGGGSGTTVSLTVSLNEPTFL